MLTRILLKISFSYNTVKIRIMRKCTEFLEYKELTKLLRKYRVSI